MATAAEWFVGEDGCIAVGEPINSVTYHSSLNILVVSTKEPTLKVIDVTSGSLLQKSNLSGGRSEHIQCMYLASSQRMVFWDSYSLGLREDISGVLLLDTALQIPVTKPDDVVHIELLLSEANQLFKCLAYVDLPSLDCAEDAESVMKELERGIDATQDLTQMNHKAVKWATVTLRLPYCTIKSVCSNLSLEMKRIGQHTLGLAVASALNDRLGYLLPSTAVNSLLGNGQVDRSLMYSEATRLDTFSKWPHMNYTWALPEPMAQAGFYHQPNSLGDDRAMCFTCNVCLVCWEPTDEPWSEHERHSPSCPFVKAEYTQNVPLSVTYATQPAALHGEYSDQIECISKTTLDQYVATSTLNGNIVVWDTKHILKKHCQFNIDPSVGVIAQCLYHSDSPQAPPANVPSTECNDAEDEADPQHCGGVVEIPSTAVPESGSNTASDVRDSTPSGDKTTDHNSDASIPSRVRPSQDVKVTAMCIVDNPRNYLNVAGVPTYDGSHVSLVCGVQLRKRQSPANYIADCAGDITSEVQLMNVVNQAVAAEEALRILPDCDAASDTTICDKENFVPYLVVVGIRPDRANVGVLHATKSSTTGLKSSTKAIVNDIYYDDDVSLAADEQTSSTQKANKKISNGKTTDDLKSASTQSNSKSQKNLQNSLNKLSGKHSVVQCIQLPVESDGYVINTINVSSDNSLLIVTLVPKFVHDTYKNRPREDAEFSELLYKTAVTIETMPTGGYVLTFDIETMLQTYPLILETPSSYAEFTSVGDSILSVLALPVEGTTYREDEESVPDGEAKGRGVVAVTTFSGHLRLLRLPDMTQLSRVSPPIGDHFTALTYCSGIERLCACSNHGKLYFYEMCWRHSDQCDDDPALHAIAGDTVDAGDPSATHASRATDILATQPLTADTLSRLHELTLFENLVPRFTATVPPCWQEIQPEQQQRRHPQHLHQQGEASHHTRTWKLNTESSTQEHLFELVLSRPCCVGHVDIKFQLHPMCTAIPRIQITLLKHKHMNIGRQPASTTEESATSARVAVDKKIDFNIRAVDASSFDDGLDPMFLETHNAEVICGPVDMCDFMDLTGMSGMVQLTSPQLLNCKPRSFLVHLKSMPGVGGEQQLIDKTNIVSPTDSCSDSKKQAKAVILNYLSMMDISGIQSSAKESSNGTKTENLTGCNWIKELSITVRRSHKTNTPRERIQRSIMLDNSAFHERLVAVASGQHPPTDQPSWEYSQNTSLALLTWLVTVQLHEPQIRSKEKRVAVMIDKTLEGLVRGCYLRGTRTTGHRCTKLLSLCLQYTKIHPPSDFSSHLLGVLLDHVALLPIASSAGAVRWFFTLLSSLRHLDPERVTSACVSMLIALSQQYHSRLLPLHSLLKTRYGLHGSPLETDLFEISPPSLMRISATSTASPTYSSIVAGTNNNNNSNSPTSGSASTVFTIQDEINIRDLFTSSGSTDKTPRFVFDYLHNTAAGLLEVEPLHFTCHSTSDGTRMERIDTLPMGMIPLSSSSGTINFGEGISNSGVPGTVLGAAMSSLSSAVTSAEAQLQQLQAQTQNKMQILKQQKQILKQKYSEQKSQSSQSASTSAATVYQGELLPPTPKSTPLFMTPDVTPPNEALQDWNIDPGKPPIPKEPIPKVNSKPDQSAARSKSYSPINSLLQLPPVPQMLVVERMHSGARRFVTLDLNDPVLLTDVMIPACGDLASLAIDVWVQGEELDGQRLVIASDISARPLIMSDIVPPIVVRFIKITMIGRYGGSTTRSRIPIGSFYGHTLITAFEWHDSLQNSLASAATAADYDHDAAQFSKQVSAVASVQADVHCRYSLAKSRLETLLATVESVHGEHSRAFIVGDSGDHRQPYSDDTKVTQAYSDCMQLQQQLNLCRRVLQRLQHLHGHAAPHAVPPETTLSLPDLLSRTITDKIRVLIEHCLDIVLASTNSPMLSSTLSSQLQPRICHDLFSQLCVNGTRRMQVHTGILLMRVCASQMWWGDFLSSLLRKYFHSQQTLIFPQDTVFVLLTVIGRRSLQGPRASTIMQSLLTTLANILSPLVGDFDGTSASPAENGCLDLSLISWILMFLCHNLDNGWSSADDTDKGAAKNSGATVPNRWSFIEGDATCPPKKTKRSSSSKAYCKTVHKRLYHHKQKLIELENAKKKILTDGYIKQHQQLFKKEFSHYASKHLKDIIQIRRTDGELIRKMKKYMSNNPSVSQAANIEREAALILPPEKCLAVVRGLIALLLSIDFTASSDLFLITCKVLARLCLSTRPAICLTEIMTQNQLEQLVSTCVDADVSNGAAGSCAWAGHAITCLLQDIIEGEKLYPGGMSVEGVTDDEISGTDTLLPDRLDLDDLEEAGAAAAAVTVAPKPSTTQVEFCDELLTEMFDESEDGDDIFQPMVENTSPSPPPQPKHLWGNVPGNNPLQAAYDKKQRFNQWKDKVTESVAVSKNPCGQCMSTAIDARLEYRLDTLSELTLKMMMSQHAGMVQSSLVSPIPYLEPDPNSIAHDFGHISISPNYAPPGSHLSSATSSVTLLGTSFDRLISRLRRHRTNLDSLLRLWLKLNDDTASCHDDGAAAANNPSPFDVSRAPLICLSPSSAASLVDYLTSTRIVPLSTWVLSLHALCLLCNQRPGDDGEAMVAHILGNPRLATMLIRFLAGTSLPGLAISQVGPTATQAFYDLLTRLQVKCPDSIGHVVKDLMLRLVYILTDDRGAIRCGFGPQDVQCKFLEFVLAQKYDQIDIGNALSVVECISDLVYDHIISQDPVACRSASENPVNARQCFGSMFANVLQMSDNQPGLSDHTRDLLMGSLLSLVSSMIQIPALNNLNTSPSTESDLSQYHSMTDSNKLSHASSTTDSRGIGSVNVHATASEVSVLSTVSSLYSTDPESYVTALDIPMIDSDYSSFSQSDEQKSVARTDEQKSETLLSQTVPLPAAIIVTAETAPVAASYFGNVVLRHEQIMSNLLHSLGHCNSSMMAVIVSSCGLPSSMQHSLVGSETLSVGDGIYRLLCNLHDSTAQPDLLIGALHKYLRGDTAASRGESATSRGDATISDRETAMSHGDTGIPPGDTRMSYGDTTTPHGVMSQLSEPLIWFILKVLDSESAITSFIDIGGLDTICERLTSCSRRLVGGGRGLVSTVLQHVNLSAKSSAPSQRKTMSGTTSNGSACDELRNFAPLGTISSSSPTASPPDVLIQSAPPHRRARSPAWSYHFYPNESWVDLAIQLPFAILLKEVHIQPHLASLNSCPAYVSLEVSHNGNLCTPVSQPAFTSSLSFIKLQLQKSEVVTNVTVRLHKARDSFTIGLSQIMLMGYSTFADGTINSVGEKLPIDSLVSKSSVGWLRLLHHCLTAHDRQSAVAVSRTIQSPHLLVTCLNHLVPSTPPIYYPSIEAILLKLGFHSPEMSLTLIHHILRRTVSAAPGYGAVYTDYSCSPANDSTVEILYRLGLRKDRFTAQRLAAMVEWVEECAEAGAHHQQSARDSPHSQPTYPAAAHVHCIAAILWHSLDASEHDDIKALVTERLIRAVYNWTLNLKENTHLKRMVDYMLCSLCRIHPHCYHQLLQWLGILTTTTSPAPHNVSDDRKDSILAPQTGPLTDDTKNAIGHALSDDATVDVQQVAERLRQRGPHLATLAIVSKSSEAVVQLLSTGFLPLLTQAISEFCTARGHTVDNNVNKTDTLHMTADLTTNVLDFLAQLAEDSLMKDWLGGPQGNVFWSQLLGLLCHQTSCLHSQPTGNTGGLCDEQLSRLESATIRFFSAVIFCHEHNQRLFTTVLCDVIHPGDSDIPGPAAVGAALSGFTRRLFLQVLLEDEKITVGMTSPYRQIKGLRAKASACTKHPRYGAGRMSCMLRVSLHDTISNLMSSVSEIPKLTAELLQTSDNPSADDDTKDTADIGIEFMEFLSNAAGISAKAKRDKLSKGNTPTRPPTRRGYHTNIMGGALEMSTLYLYHHLIPNQELPGDLSISQLITILRQHGLPHSTSSLQFKFNVKLPPAPTAGSSNAQGNSLQLPQATGDFYSDSSVDSVATEILLDTPACHTPLHTFASIGGLALLAQHLPLYPEVSKPPVITPDTLTVDPATCQVADPGHDWVTVESSDDYYEQLYEPPSSGVQSMSTPRANRNTAVPAVPPHSLVAFGLFLRLPGYADVLLKERKKAQCLLRLVLGVTDDGDGGHILLSPIASSLPTLPFHVLKSLFDDTSPTTDDGVLLRRMALEIGVLHLLLACLSVLSHHAPRSTTSPGSPASHSPTASESPAMLSTLQSMSQNAITTSMSDEKAQNYWAKGTGFGTGSTTSNWDAELALIRQKSEEEHVAVLLQVIASYIDGGPHTPHVSPLLELLSQSCLVPAICSYLRNDSVLDMARHVPLYRSLLQLLRSVSTNPSLITLLLPLDGDDATCIATLLQNMRDCVDTYSSRLKSNKGKVENKVEEIEEESEGLALLIPDIQNTATIVKKATDGVNVSQDESTDREAGAEPRPSAIVVDMSQYYMSSMKPLQFDTYEFVTEEGGSIRFTMPHHYESNVRSAGDVNNPARARRLAQEAVTLSTSLPLSASSSVFVRCDEERLDIMKVLITGPADTPYANGCFEFDIYFPSDYPISPPNINLETTGNRTVRFNPNLYNDGKVCLSVLNTWHGRPEEKWNAQTSSFLQVLVSIQSLILVSEPYFNEPGYERSRGTPSGMASSRDYDANIRQATVKWAMLDQLKNPSPCFKEVIHKHFWLKRHEILQQCENWISVLEGYDQKTSRTIPHNTMALKRHYNYLREELAKLSPPEGLAENASPSPIDPQAHHYNTADIQYDASTKDSIVVDLPPMATEDDNMVLDIIQDTLASLDTTDLSGPCASIPMDQLPVIDECFLDDLESAYSKVNHLLVNPSVTDTMAGQNPDSLGATDYGINNNYYTAHAKDVPSSQQFYMPAVTSIPNANYYMPDGLNVSNSGYSVDYFIPPDVLPSPPSLPNYYMTDAANMAASNFYLPSTSNASIKTYNNDSLDATHLPVNGIADYTEIVPFLNDSTNMSNEQSPIGDDGEFQYIGVLDPYITQDEVDC